MGLWQASRSKGNIAVVQHRCETSSSGFADTSADNQPLSDKILNRKVIPCPNLTFDSAAMVPERR